MNWLRRRRLRKHIKGINFDKWLKTYGSTGEYEAMMWLKSYSEGRAGTEPLNLVKSLVIHSPQGINSRDRLYILTLLEWC